MEKNAPSILTLMTSGDGSECVFLGQFEANYRVEPPAKARLIRRDLSMCWFIRPEVFSSA